jgi:hypothetical protein
MSFLGVFGDITNPFSVLGGPAAYTGSTEGQGLITLLTSLIRLSIIIAGLYTLINLILAGYGFLSAGGDAKLVQKSQERIWRSVVGLVIVVASVIFASVIGYIVFGSANWNLIISPKIFKP